MIKYSKYRTLYSEKTEFSSLWLTVVHIALQEHFTVKDRFFKSMIKYSTYSTLRTEYNTDFLNLKLNKANIALWKYFTVIEFTNLKFNKTYVKKWWEGATTGTNDRIGDKNWW